MSDKFIPQKGYYRKLRVYQIAEIIYDVTFIFTQRFLSKGDRTIDQMIQAARSGKQNIAEGSAAGSTSKETEIKLTNVAKASLQELLIDYEDFLRTRDFELWEKDSPKAVVSRRICAGNNDSSFFREAVKTRSAETVANIAIILIHQADVLLYRLIERQKADFLRHGGIREQMTKARVQYRSAQSSRSSQSSPSTLRTPKMDEAFEGVDVVMMCGVSGAGKTFVARGLEAQGFVRLSADADVWQAYGEGYARMPQAEQHVIYMRALGNIIGRVPELLRHGKRVVIDASMCKRARRDEVADICRQTGAKHVIAYLDSSRDTLVERLKARGGTGPDDQFVSEEELDRFLAHFEVPEADERFIHIKNNTASTKA